MFVAHLPSGYLLGRGLLGRGAGARGPAMAAVLLGSVAPDFDMLWFHLVDHGRVHHHDYYSHIPGFWLLVALSVLAVLRGLRPAWVTIAAMFFAGIVLHLVLDTLVGGIMWLWPFSDHLYSLAVVPARHDHWVISFILHWSFLAEIVLTLLAAWVLWRDRRRVSAIR